MQTNRREMEQHPAENQAVDAQNASNVNIQHMHRLQSQQVMTPMRTAADLPGTAHQNVLYQDAVQDLQSTLPYPPHMSSAAAMSAQQQLTNWAEDGRYVQQTVRYPADVQAMYDFRGQLMAPGNIAYHPTNVDQLMQYTYSAPQQRSDQSSVNHYAPWQTVYSPTHGLAWSSGAVQGSTLVAQGNPFLTRNPQQEAQPGLFIQNSQTQLQLSQIDGRHVSVTKTAITEAYPTMLPNPVNSTMNNMPAQQTQMHTFQPPMQSQKADTKVSTKNMIRIMGVDNPQKNNTNPTNMVTTPTRASSLTHVTPSGPTIRTAPLPNIYETKRMKQFWMSEESPVQTRAHGQLAPNLQLRSNGNLMSAPLHVNHGNSAALEAINLPDSTVSTLVQSRPADSITGVSTSIQNLNGTPMTQDVPTTALPKRVKITDNCRAERIKVTQEVEDAAAKPRPSGEAQHSNYDETGKKSTFKSEVVIETEETQDEEKKNVDVDKSNEKATPSRATVMVKPQKITHLDESFEKISIDRKSKYEREKNEVVGSTSGDDELANPKAFVGFGKEGGISSNEQRIKPNLSNWTVADVYEFIRTVPGCSDYAEDFAAHDVDGEALMLLKPDHLVTALSITLGPAMKILARVDAMRENDGSFKE